MGVEGAKHTVMGLLRHLGLVIFIFVVCQVHSILFSRHYQVDEDSSYFDGSTQSAVHSRFDRPRRSVELIHESQRLARSILRQVIGTKTKVALFDLESIENKGDPAIGVGEFFLLESLSLEVIFYCPHYCKKNDYNRARAVVEGYMQEDVVFLMSGGGNFGGYPNHDRTRFTLMKMFRDYQFVMLSQSVWFQTEKHLQTAIKEYSSHPALTILLRDESSYNFTCKHFPSVHAVLTPDMAFNIGQVDRFMPPLYDVVWIQRGDGESPGQSSDRFPPGISFVRQDWYNNWPSPKGQNVIDQIVASTHNGLMFLQRGRVVVTDRLHGFILSRLLDIPTVIIDNKIKKLSSFRNTWATNLENVVIARNGSDAVAKAMWLLQEYNASLPHIDEY